MKKVLVSLLVLAMVFASFSGGLLSAAETDFATVTSVETQTWAEVWYIVVFTFDEEVGAEYMNSSWYTANGIRVSEHMDGIHSNILVYGEEGNQIAIYFHDNIRPSYGINKDANDVFEFSPVDAKVVYSVDIEMPATFAGRGNIVLSGSSLGVADITDNDDAVILTFFKAGELLRVGLHEALDTSGEPNAGLQVRRDAVYIDKFTLQLTVDKDGKFMLYILNKFADHAYINQRAINHINWNNLEAPQITDDLRNGYIYDATIGAGWEGHDGVISFFNNFPTDLKVVYDTSAVAYTYTNQVINNITEDATTPAPTTAPVGDGGTTAPGDNGVVAIALISVIALGSLVVVQKKRILSK